MLKNQFVLVLLNVSFRIIVRIFESRRLSFDSGVPFRFVHGRHYDVTSH